MGIIFGNKFLTEGEVLDVNLYEEAYKNFYKDNNHIITESSEVYQEFIDILNEDVTKDDNKINKIDADEGHGAELRPVFIVLLYSDTTFDHIAEKFVKNQDYWHAALSFGPALTHCYSFSFGDPEAGTNKFKGGLSFENIKMYQEGHPNGTMEVNCIFLDEPTFKQLKETLNYYIKNKEKTRYSFINLLYSLFGKKTKNGLKFNLVCSTFVDTILKSVNVNVTGTNKATNLTKPDDLKAKKSNKKQFKLFEGNLLKYKVEEIKKKVEKLANELKNNFFSDTKKEKKD